MGFKGINWKLFWTLVAFTLFIGFLAYVMRHSPIADKVGLKQ